MTRYSTAEQRTEWLADADEYTVVDPDARVHPGGGIVTEAVRFAARIRVLVDEVQRLENIIATALAAADGPERPKQSHLSLVEQTEGGAS